MPLSQERIDQAIDDLLELAQSTDAVRTELHATFEQFRAAGEPGDTAHALASRRAAEWFLLERPSTALQGVPLELLMHGAIGSEDELPDQEVLQALVGSFCGVFEVSDVRPGEGVWVRDLLAFGEHPLAEPEGSHALERGDVLVGRLFPVGAGLHRISPAAGVFRSRGLVTALAHDLERAREGRRGVARLSQAELESMFFGERAEAPSDAQLPSEAQRIERARTVLAHAGLEPQNVELVLQRLATTPLDSQRVLLDAADPIAAVLDALAFETDVDLDVVRTALLEAWPGLARPQAVRASPDERSGPVDVERAVAAFDRGRAEGRDLEQLFRELEGDLDLDGQEAQAEESLAPDFPGVVGAMVEEFIWDTEREQGPDAARAHRCLTRLSAFGAPIGVFEELGARDLLSFCAVWLPEWGELAGAEEARAVLNALRAFCQWAEEQHEVPLRQAFEAEVAALEDSLPRIAEANRHRLRVDDVTLGDLYIVEQVDEAHVAVHDAGGARHVLELDLRMRVHLRAGDHLRANREGAATLLVYCCYPPECAALQPRG